MQGVKKWFFRNKSFDGEGDRPQIVGSSVELKDLIALEGQVKKIPFFSSKKALTFVPGSSQTNIKGRGIEFSEVRSYQSGDDIRHMDWRVTARTGKPHTKLYHEEHERFVYLLVDYSSSMFFGTQVAYKSVIAAQIASLLGWAAIKNHERVGAFLFTGDDHIELKPRANKQGILPILQKLASTRASGVGSGNHITQTLKRLQFVAKPGSVIFIISDFNSFDESFNKAITLLSKHNDIICFSVNDPLEKSLPSQGLYQVTDGNRELEINTYDKAFFEQYRLRFQSKRRELVEMLKRSQIPLIELMTNEPVVGKLSGGVRV